MKLACGEAKLPEALKASEGTEEASLGLAVTGGMPETDRRAAVGDEARLPVPGRPDPTGPDTARLSELVRRRGLPPVPITAGVEVWRVSLGRGRSSMDENDTLRGRMELSDGLTEACHGTVIQGDQRQTQASADPVRAKLTERSAELELAFSEPCGLAVGSSANAWADALPAVPANS